VPVGFAVFTAVAAVVAAVAVAVGVAVALMLALVTYHSLPELVSSTSNVTIVKNPGTEDMEIIIKQGERVEVQKITDEDVYGMGKVLGTTFLLADGTVIYVPENRVVQQCNWRVVRGSVLGVG